MAKFLVLLLVNIVINILLIMLYCYYEFLCYGTANSVILFVLIWLMYFFLTLSHSCLSLFDYFCNDNEEL